MTDLKDKVVLVTGGGRGIGRAVALELAQRGAKVAVVARSQAEVETVANEIKRAGREAIALSVDVSQSEAIAHQAVQSVLSAFGSVDILVNNAAVNGPYGTLWEVDATEWTRAIQTNVFAPFWLSQAVLPTMLAARWGRIINVSSGAARNPMARFGAYSTTKAALDMLTRQLGAELAESGVSAISVYPGTVETQMQTDIRQQPAEKIGEAMSQRFHAFYNSGQLQAPSRPAGLIANLSGEAGANLNGQIVDINDKTYAHLVTNS